MSRAVIVVVGLLLITATAYADRARDLKEAREYFTAGKQAYKAGKYRFAVSAFEQAYRIVRRPSIIFSLAQAHRRQYFVDRQPRDLKRALELFKQYLRDVPDGDRRTHAVEHIANLEPLWTRVEATLDAAAQKASQQPAAQPTQLMISSQTPGARAAIGRDSLSAIPVTKDVAPGKHMVRVEAPGYFSATVQAIAVAKRLIVLPVELKPRPASLVVHGSAGGRVMVDGRPQGALPLDGALALAAGEHFVAVVKRGHEPYTQLLRLGNGERREVSADLRISKQRRVSYYILGGAGALALGGAVTGLLAWSAQDGAQEITDKSAATMMALTPTERDDHNDLLTRRNRFRTAAYILSGTALVTAATGLLLYLSDNPHPRPPRTRITPTLGPTPLGAGIAARF